MYILLIHFKDSNRRRYSHVAQKNIRKKHSGNNSPTNTNPWLCTSNERLRKLEHRLIHDFLQTTPSVLNYKIF